MNKFSEYYAHKLIKHIVHNMTIQIRYLWWIKSNVSLFLLSLLPLILMPFSAFSHLSFALFTVELEEPRETQRQRHKEGTENTENRANEQLDSCTVYSITVIYIHSLVSGIFL